MHFLLQTLHGTHTKKLHALKTESEITGLWKNVKCDTPNVLKWPNSDKVVILTTHVDPLGWWCKALKAPIPSFVQKCDCVNHIINWVDFGLTQSNSWSIASLKASRHHSTYPPGFVQHLFYVILFWMLNNANSQPILLTVIYTINMIKFFIIYLSKCTLLLVLFKIVIYMEQSST